MAEERKRRGRPEDAYIRDPAVAVAIAKCVLARMFVPTVLGDMRMLHPEECGFEEMDTDYLLEKLIEFNTWSGTDPVDHYNPGEPPMSALQPRIEQWNRLEPDQQRALVRQAQGYDNA